MATFSLPSDLVPKPVDVNAVDTALRLGWAGFKRHPWLLAIPLLVMEMGAYMLAAALVGSEMVVSDSMDHWLESDRAAALAWLQSPAAAQLMVREERARLLRLYRLEASR